MTRKYLSANVHYFSLFLLHLRQFHHRLRRMAQYFYIKHDRVVVICGEITVLPIDINLYMYNLW